ncbi:LacI family DNA-binding transcriptional regulator [Brachyspira hyodysenteriae]|nr:LacI family DNA-binding transcriptional regulator [Brachyspira hyodysenteriae]MDA1470221.1 LacI family DNA-binding transcriptional regulator [Brachyspira hyodysenteriae]
MNDKKITLNYIAKKANVSVATVSRVLNGNSSVDEKIQNKIKKIIKTDGYNLKKLLKAKQIISVIIPDITNPFCKYH